MLNGSSFTSTHTIVTNRRLLSLTIIYLFNLKITHTNKPFPMKRFTGLRVLACLHHRSLFGQMDFGLFFILSSVRSHSGRRKERKLVKWEMRLWKFWNMMKDWNFERVKLESWRSDQTHTYTHTPVVRSVRCVTQGPTHCKRANQNLWMPTNLLFNQIKLPRKAPYKIERKFASLLISCSFSVSFLVISNDRLWWMGDWRESEERAGRTSGSEALKVARL